MSTATCPKRRQPDKLMPGKQETTVVAWLAQIGESDERRCCTQCLNLRGAVCIVAKPGGLVSANVGYRPVQGIPQRCAGYSPNADDPDQRPGHERWPGLTNQTR